MSIGFRVERKFLEGWLQGSVVEVGQHKFENAALVEFHHDDCTYEDILSETDFGRFMGAGSLRLDPPVEEDKSTVASAAEKKRPKARARARRGSSTEPQETQIERDADGWTKEEVDRLLTAVDNEELVNQGFWKRIAKAVGTKTAKECNRRYCRGSKKSPAPHRNKPPGPRTRPQSDDDGEIGADDCATDVPYKKDGVRRFRAIQQYMTDHQFVNKEEDLLMDGLVAGDLGDLPLSDSDSEISWDMNDIKIGGTPKAEARHKSTRRNSVDSVSSVADNSEYDPFTYAQPYEQRVDPTSYTLCQTLHRQRQALLEGHRNRTLGLDIGNVRPPYACQPIITEDDEDGDECLVEALEKVDQRNRLERQREKYVNSDGELDEDFFSDDQEVI
ncbi:hypothetical protein Pmar_PMAR008771 [Perkinsus marinus ATCC 50983]|uniref:Myb-like domain-containing protein n=1 Tax=Perkinsus marinus (strain ATCC 50983 / TXsc) TaxID=423536 RepID=C5L0Y9_PERM5|nr:hypothetical protein Pmar_PMAR008771 [Perkinsus marinus ATCC 50983]EER09631.1 hypothetical protein Pmar_PMAR008771 [Perkinsus marinus ATCC 50983]|eukprot:XP_002777836.1 hypothetical protein Pmar_PMAR008771 [Perkinsus marinus ATCC 50983]